LQTIYLADNDNVFYFNCPALGVNQEKYIIKNNGGLLMPANNQTNQAAMSHATAAQKAQLEALQRQLAQTNQAARDAGAAKTMDIDLLTSNMKAMYTKDGDFTTITFQGNSVAMVSGRPTDLKRNFMISLTFPGEKAGSYKIKTKDIIAASFVIMDLSAPRGCTCAFNPENDPSSNPPCMGGTIYISKYEPRIGGMVEGEVMANIQGALGQTIIFGDLNGKFKVKLAKAE